MRTLIYSECSYPCHARAHVRARVQAYIAVHVCVRAHVRVSCEFHLRQIATLNRGIGKHSALFVVSQWDSQQQEGPTN
jgi:hypothetical protein